MTAVRTRYERARSAGIITDYVQKYVDAAWKEATASFVVATAGMIKVDTGMSMASLFAIGKEVGVKGRVQGILQSRGPKGPKPGIKDAAHWEMPSNVLPQKSIPAGERLGASAYTLTDGNRNLSRWVFRLRYDISVLQWAFHEDEWNAIKTGMSAFDETFNRAIKRLMPAQMLSDYINRGKTPAAISIARTANAYLEESNAD
jgi:hypothetical protein